MRETPGMEFRPKLRLSLAVSLTAFALAGFAGGCGGDDDGGSETPAPTESVTKPEQPAPNTTGPASAGDEREPAPDDKISDRPGGPGSGGPQPKPAKP